MAWLTPALRAKLVKEAPDLLVRPQRPGHPGVDPLTRAADLFHRPKRPVSRHSLRVAPPGRRATGP
jgi:hypothetical protein